MSATRMKRALALPALAATIVLAGGAAAQGAAPPVKLVPSSVITNGFEFPQGVAVQNDAASPEHGDVYVVDNGSHRVQVLSASGVFVAMFGQEVDATTKANICTAASGDACQAGVDGEDAGQFSKPYSIAIDSTSGDIYVGEYVFNGGEIGQRVQKFTAEGKFLLEIGREVNATTKANLCSEEEAEKGSVCAGPAPEVPESNESGAFNFEAERGVLAVGGKEDLLYVGEEGRVQEFDASGKTAGSLPLASISTEQGRVRALALDQESGNLYLVYPSGNVIHELNPKGEEIKSFAVHPGKSEGEVFIKWIAADPPSRLAVVASENGQSVGSLYNMTATRRISEFAIPSEVFVQSIAFGGEGEMYASSTSNNEVLSYVIEPIPELVLGAASCTPGADSESSVTNDCTLSGEANPEGISETELLFEWGRTPALGERTADQTVTTPGTVQAVLSLRPNETFYYQLAGNNHNVKLPEQFATEEASLATPAVAPRIIRAPETSFVKTSSVVMSGELNPENASTEYFFEYSPSEEALAECPGVRKASCPGVLSTPATQSSVYGEIGATFEVSGLQPGAMYHLRLFAEGENRAQTERFATLGPEGSFTTASRPLPSAETGGYGAVTSTNAVVSGTIDPDGLPANYAFEVGVYNGASTQYTSVLYGFAGSGSAPVREEFALSGLQPGTTYAYRITVLSGYIENESHSLQGAPAIFSTAGTPAALASPVSPPLLAVPAIKFPSSGKPTSKGCKRGYVRSKRGKCVRQKHQKSKKKARKG